MNDTRKSWVDLNRDRIRAKAREWYAANSEKRKLAQRVLREKNIKYSLIRHAKLRSESKGIPFDIVAEDIIIPTICPILKCPLVINKGKLGPDSITLDRIKPELGYVRGNIQVISHRANTMKNAATEDELLKFADWVKENIGVTND